LPDGLLPKTPPGRAALARGLLLAVTVACYSLTTSSWHGELDMVPVSVSFKHVIA
jgi:hypothetical protein